MWQTPSTGFCDRNVGPHISVAHKGRTSHRGRGVRESVRTERGRPLTVGERTEMAQPNSGLPVRSTPAGRTRSLRSPVQPSRTMPRLGQRPVRPGARHPALPRRRSLPRLLAGRPATETPAPASQQQATGEAVRVVPQSLTSSSGSVGAESGKPSAKPGTATPGGRRHSSDRCGGRPAGTRIRPRRASERRAGNDGSRCSAARRRRPRRRCRRAQWSRLPKCGRHSSAWCAR